MTADLLASNLRWAAGRARQGPPDPAPEAPAAHFWIGCFDDAAQIHEAVGAAHADMLVHRTLANLAPPYDAGFLASLQYAVETVRVRHIIVCGHYGCEAVRSAVEAGDSGPAGHWLQPVRALQDSLARSLDAIANTEARLNRLCEHNVAAQVASLAANALVQKAWRRGHPLSLHGWIRSASDSLIRDLDLTISSRKQATDRFQRL